MSPPRRPSPGPDPGAAGFVPFATAALDFHRALSLPSAPLAAPLAASRADLDALHAHLVTLFDVLDTHAQATAPVNEREGDHLTAAAIRLWQAADHLHTAYHTAPHPTGGEARRAGRPEGAPELTICQRHQTTGLRVRHRTTPAGLYAPFTGLIRH